MSLVHLLVDSEDLSLTPAQFFKGVATVCTKLFNAVEVGSAVTWRDSFGSYMACDGRRTDISPITHTLVKRISSRPFC